MMSLQRNLAVLLLLLNASFFLHSYVLIHAASTSPPVTLPRIIFLTALSSDDDYYDDDTETKSSSPDVVVAVKTPVLHQGSQPCQYDPCLENQEPCAHLREETGCLCPGISGADKPPHAPRIQTLLPISEGGDRGKVEVKWCAPSSVVSTYRVVVQGQDGDVLEVGDGLRRSVVGSLEKGTKVCVEALNQAGRSSPSDFSCQRYDPPTSSDHHLLALIIGGGLLLLVIILVSVILWKYKTCRKGKGNSANGLHPSYRAGETL
ncbi:leucine-rich repeat neuronal protein 4 [Betta splendens]|uniref:Leucine-rich repeat neuronal protein 4 n=1 Tax=Betta splendens TaxID=158456 RepID=A0A6P7NW82_BETSP|nr:leucine-rich repeat neuronal protein 4 [Betta splendens]